MMFENSPRPESLEQGVFLDLGKPGMSPFSKALGRYLPEIPVVRTWDDINDRHLLGCIIPMNGFWHLSKALCDDLKTQSFYDWIGPEDPSLIEKLDCPVIFDGATEGTYFREDVAIDYFENTASWLKPERTVILQNNAALPEAMDKWAKQHGHKSPKFVAWSFFVDSLLDFNSRKSADHNKSYERDKVFLSMNNKPRLHRASLRVLFEEERFADKTLCSFPEFADEDLLEATRTLGDWGFISGEASSGNYGPIKLDDHPGRGVETVFSISDEFYGKTYMSVVTETEMSSGNVLRFTEKIIKPILKEHPFLVLGNPHTLKALHDYGFHTFSPHFDETYDQEIDSEKRLKAVLSEIDRIAKFDKRQMTKLCAGLGSITSFNANHARTTFRETLRKEFIDIVNGIRRMHGKSLK